jgi:glycine oxidase
MTDSVSSRRTSDVLVIGGGFIGLAAALELARAKLSVTVLERETLGSEASWAGAGLTKPCSWNRHDPMAQLLRRGIWLHRTKNPQLVEETGIDVEYSVCGRLGLLVTDQQVRMAHSEIRGAEHYAEQYGSPLIDVIDIDEARRIEPAIGADAPAVVRCFATAQLRNPRVIQALRAACEKAEVSIVENEPVTALLREGARVVGARTQTSEYSAGHTVLAAGAWSSRFDQDVRKLAPVEPVRGQIALLYMDRTLFHHVIERGPCYLIPRRDGHILVGATTEPDAGFDKSTTRDGIDGLLADAFDIVPALKDASLVKTWAGLRPGTPDHRPVIGIHESCPGLIFATGHYKTGICLMWITARVVCDLIVNGRTEVNLERCRPGRDFTSGKKHRRDRAPKH